MAVAEYSSESGLCGGIYGTALCIYILVQLRTHSDMPAVQICRTRNVEDGSVLSGYPVEAWGMFGTARLPDFCRAQPIRYEEEPPSFTD